MTLISLVHHTLCTAFNTNKVREIPSHDGRPILYTAAVYCTVYTVGHEVVYSAGSWTTYPFNHNSTQLCYLIHSPRLETHTTHTHNTQHIASWCVFSGTKKVCTIKERLVSSYGHIRQLRTWHGAQSVNIHSRVPTNTHISMMMVTLTHLRFLHLAVHRSWPWWLLERFLRLGIQVTCGGGSLALYGVRVLVGRHLYSWFLLLVSGWFLGLCIQVTRGCCLALYGVGVLVHGSRWVARLPCLHILLLGLFTIRF